MKTILCYGDSNTWGAAPMAGPDAPVERFAPDIRWPGVLRRNLGEGFLVIEEGLNGRTTCRDDFVEGAHKNGATFLPVCLESHMPVDLLIVTLGTNDLKARFSMQAGDIAAGAGNLASMAKRSSCGPAGGPPEVLLVCPAPLARLGWLAEMFEGGAEKSRRLAPAMEAEARRSGAHFLDAGTLISSSEVDGIHLDADQHAILGRAIAERVRALA